MFAGLLDFDSSLFFLPSARRGLRGHPYKVPQGASQRRRRGSAFLARVVKYWNKLPASVVTATSVNVFKKRVEQVRTEIFSHLPHWLNAHLPISLRCQKSSPYQPWYFITNNWSRDNRETWFVKRVTMINQKFGQMVNILPKISALDRKGRSVPYGQKATQTTDISQITHTNHLSWQVRLTLIT